MPVPTLPARVAPLLQRLTGVPLLFDMHALWPEELISAGQLRLGFCLHRCIVWLKRRCFAEAASVVSLTQEAMDHLPHQLPSQLASKPFALIPTCTDLERFTPAPTTGSDPQLVIGSITTALPLMLVSSPSAGILPTPSLLPWVWLPRCSPGFSSRQRTRRRCRTGSAAIPPR